MTERGTTSAAAALGAAFRDLYRQSWRFFLLNAALSLFVVPILVAGLWVPAIWLLLVGAGPLAAALMHCAVVVAVTEELRLRDALVGLRLHWRRGLALGATLGIGAAGAVFAVSFYAGRGALVLAVACIYLGAMFAVFQLVLWPVAVLEFRSPIRQVATDATRAALRRPLQTGLLALALLAVNAAGIAAAVMPFLTLTIAYSCLAAARFVLPASREEVPAEWPA
jgi:hypothetical protein